MGETNTVAAATIIAKEQPTSQAPSESIGLATPSLGKPVQSAQESLKKSPVAFLAATNSTATSQSAKPEAPIVDAAATVFRREDLIPIKIDKIRLADVRVETRIDPVVPSAGMWLRLGNKPDADVLYCPSIYFPCKPENRSWYAKAKENMAETYRDYSCAVKGLMREVSYKVLGYAANLMVRNELASPESVIEQSRVNVLKERRESFAGEGQKSVPNSWADIDKIADRKVCLTRDSIQKLEAGPNVVIVHASNYDTPGNPRYELCSWSNLWKREQFNRKNAGYAFTKTADQLEKELGGASVYLAQSVAHGAVLAATPTGDTSIHEIYNYARLLKENPELNAATKRYLIHRYMRSLIGDDQTLQSGVLGKEGDVHTVGPREVVMQKAGVCRHLAGILYGAYNLGGIKTELHCSNGHQWVESYDEGNTVVTVDPNANFNYVEFPGSRGGAYAKPDGTVVPDKTTSKKG